MSILLSDGESLIKDWDYASGKGNDGKYHANLIVTSKRIISKISSKHYTSYEDVPLNTVKSVTCSQGKKSNFWPICGIILGVLFMIAVVGIILIVFCVKKLNQGEFSLCITTDGFENKSIVIGAVKDKGKGGFFSRLFSKFKRNKFKVRIDFNTANEICETIGAIILNNKAA